MKNNTTREIENQFTTWLKIDEVISNNKSLITQIKDYVDDETNIIFAGAGTSGYIGDLLETYLNNQGIINQYTSVYTTNIVGNPKIYFANKKVLLVSFARSGNSPESCEAVVLANQYAKEAEHLIITCNENGQLARDYPSNSILLPSETNDLGFAMTNSFSTMLITAAKIFGLSIDLQRVVNAAHELYETVDYQQILAYPFENIIYLANSENVGLLNELKLKFMELTNGQYGYYHDQFLNFRHGPKSVITKKSLIIVVSSDEKVAQKYELDLVNELLNDENEPQVINFGNLECSCLQYKLDLSGFEKALAIIPACQQLAVKASEQLGINPDNPSPSGSVNRVVQGVKIYRR